MWRVMRQVRQVMRQVRRAIDVWVACRYFLAGACATLQPATVPPGSSCQATVDLNRPAWAVAASSESYMPKSGMLRLSIHFGFLWSNLIFFRTSHAHLYLQRRNH